MMPPMKWPSVKLDTYVDLLTGYPFKSKGFSDNATDIPLVKGDNVQHTFIDWGRSKRWPKLSIQNLDKYWLISGDIVLALDRPWLESGLKYSWIKNDDPKALLVQRVARMRGINGLTTDYLRYLIASPAFTDYIKPILTGVTVPHLSPSQIKSFQFRLPPHITQHKITNILSAYDDLIENNTRRIAILEEMAKRIYEEWFVNFRFPDHETMQLVESELGPVPEGWDVETLDKALVLQRGFDLPAGDRNPGQFPIIAASGVIAYHTKKRADGPGVVTGRSGTIGKVMYVTEDFWPLNTALWVKEFLRVSPLYGFHMLSRIDFSAVVGGAAVPTLNRNHVHAMKIVIPPEEMVIRFDQAVDPLQKLARNLELKNTNLRQTRDLLLPRLISGELDVSTLPIPEDMAA